jgi:chromosome segregation ATPase
MSDEPVGEAEKIAHMALRGFQQKKEYFSCTPTEAIPLIKQELDKHIRFSTIDVKAIKSTIRDYTDRISTLRQEIVSINNEYHLETEKQNNFFSQKLTKRKDELDREFKDQAKRSKGVFIIIALLICGVSLWLGKEILYVVLCPVSLIWVPLLLKYFPLFAENIKEHKDKYSAFESEVNKNKSKRLEELNKARSRELKRINEEIDDLNKHKASHEKMLSVLNR